MLPKDIHMLVSFINMKLRDDDYDLSHVIEIYEINEEELLENLKNNNYYYDEKQNQIK